MVPTALAMLDHISTQNHKNIPRLGEVFHQKRDTQNIAAQSVHFEPNGQILYLSTPSVTLKYLIQYMEEKVVLSGNKTVDHQSHVRPEFLRYASLQLRDTSENPFNARVSGRRSDCMRLLSLNNFIACFATI